MHWGSSWPLLVPLGVRILERSCSTFELGMITMMFLRYLQWCSCEENRSTSNAKHEKRCGKKLEGPLNRSCGNWALGLRHTYPPSADMELSLWCWRLWAWPTCWDLRRLFLRCVGSCRSTSFSAWKIAVSNFSRHASATCSRNHILYVFVVSTLQC